MITFKVLTDFAEMIKNLNVTFPLWEEREGNLLSFKWCISQNRIWVIGFPYYEDNDPPAYLYAEWEIVHNIYRENDLSFYESKRFITDKNVEMFLEWFKETHNGKYASKNLRA